MESYKVPAGDAEFEFIEKRSRFIGRIWVTQTEEEALERIKAMRQQHWDATHNVYAYIIHEGPTRYSDDGEPQGTAGMPVLEVLRGSRVENVCCVVTRYFGGTLLGTGGLVRAYGKAARDALQEAGIAVKQLWKRLDLILPYSYFERLRQEVERFDGIVEETEYGADICLHVLLPALHAPDFNARVTDLTRGSVCPIEAGEEFRAVEIAK
ncbi:MAG: YigZ family protein [Oscillospiraceae bacterium]|nr:YigZ family protein [Oscillospiraceae bacterium]